MRKTLLVVILLFSSLVANELKTLPSYKSALEKAKEENKYILLMLSYEGCPVCAYMKDIVFEREKVRNYLNQHFYVVIKDIEKDHYPKRFWAVDAPTFFFIEPKTEAEAIKKQVGGFQPDKFLTLLQTVTGEANTTLEEIEPPTSLPCTKESPCEQESPLSLP